MTVVAPAGSFPNLRHYMSIDIANGASLSEAAPLAGMVLVGIIIPSSWTAADLTFQASHDGTNYANVYGDDGAERTVEADASRFIMLDPVNWLSASWLKVRSGTAGLAVNQGAARTITLVLVP